MGAPARVTASRAVIRRDMVSLRLPYMIGRERIAHGALVRLHEGQPCCGEGRHFIRFDVSRSGQLRDIVIGTQDERPSGICIRDFVPLAVGGHPVGTFACECSRGRLHALDRQVSQDQERRFEFRVVELDVFRRRQEVEGCDESGVCVSGVKIRHQPDAFPWRSRNLAVASIRSRVD